MSETRVASYQEPGVRLQLVRIEKEDLGTDGMPTCLSETFYQIRRNRKVLYNAELLDLAIKRFQICINYELNQKKLFL